MTSTRWRSAAVLATTALLSAGLHTSTPASAATTGTSTASAVAAAPFVGPVAQRLAARPAPTATARPRLARRTVRPVAKPVAKPAAKPTVKPVAKPVATPVAKPVAKPVATPVAAPVGKPVVAPVAGPTAPAPAAAAPAAAAPAAAVPAAAAPAAAAPAAAPTAGTTATTPTAAVPAARPVEIGLPVNAAELTPAQLAEVLDLAKAAGATTISSGAVWWFLTEQGGARRYDFSSLDRLVTAAAARGLTVDLQLSGTPDWLHPQLAQSGVPFGERIWHAPRTSAELAAWSAYVGDVVSHFGPKVARYELWNEPNLVEFWRTGPSPADYAALLHAGYLAAKAASPSAVVVSAGLSRNDVGFATKMYDALGTYPGAVAASHFFDELGVHPYSDDRGPSVRSDRWVHDGPFGEIDDNFLGLEKMAALVRAEGEPAKRLWVGEYGFSTKDTWMKAVPDAVRGQHLRSALGLVRSMPQVAGLVWYHFVPTSTDDAAWTMITLGGGRSATYEAMVADAKEH